MVQGRRLARLHPGWLRSDGGQRMTMKQTTSCHACQSESPAVRLRARARVRFRHARRLTMIIQFPTRRPLADSYAPWPIRSATRLEAAKSAMALSRPLPNEPRRLVQKTLHPRRSRSKSKSKRPTAPHQDRLHPPLSLAKMPARTVPEVVDSASRGFHWVSQAPRKRWQHSPMFARQISWKPKIPDCRTESMFLPSYRRFHDSLGLSRLGKTKTVCFRSVVTCTTIVEQRLAALTFEDSRLIQKD